MRNSSLSQRRFAGAAVIPSKEGAFLELVEPDIAAGGADCVAQGATKVILLPYFLSPGKHVVEDLAEAKKRLSQRFPQVRFVLAEPLGRHPLLLQAIEERAQEAEGKQ